MEKNNYFSKDIRKRFVDIEMSLKKLILYRNKVEHDIDPYYYGFYEEVEKEFNIDKLICFIKKIIFLLNKLFIYKINFKKTKFEMKYERLSVLSRKEKIFNLQHNFKNIFLHTIELSYRIEKNHEKMYLAREQMINSGKTGEEIKKKLIELKTSDEEKIIIDLALKTIELNKAIRYIDEQNKNRYFEIELQDNLIDTYIYFSHMCLTIIYQIYDKVGLYLTNKLPLKCKNTYFKTVVNEITSRKMISKDICNKLSNLKESNYYKELSKIRNFMVHERGVVNYTEYSDEISTLIINNYEEIINIVDGIIKSYFNVNTIKISDKATNEFRCKI